MSHDSEWPRPQAERRIADLLDAAKTRGMQKVIDRDGTFEVMFVPSKQSLEELFSKPGPISEEE